MSLFDRNGGKYFSFDDNSPATLTERVSEFHVPADGATITQILDEDGNNVTTTYLNSSTVLKAGASIRVTDEGKFFTSITGTAGAINYVNA